MTLMILSSIAAGIIIGMLTHPFWIQNFATLFIDIGTILLLIMVGISIGLNSSVFEQIKSIGLKLLLMPLAVVVGSIGGAAIGGYLVGLPFNEAGAVGAGQGFYTITSIILASHSNQLSTIGFIANLTRELASFIFIPVIAKKLGYLETIAPAGSTSIASALPIISRSTDAETVVIAFITGVICTALVPVLIPLILNL